MARPIEFPEQTTVIARDQPQCMPLPVSLSLAMNSVPQLVSCWQLTPEEITHIMLTGKIYVRQLTFGQPLQPQSVHVFSPFEPHAGEPPLIAVWAANQDKPQTPDLDPN